MLMSVLLLLFALVLVFAAAQLFTNALEYIGERMGLSEGVTGSVFAAVGTAMPETIVPMVAILAGGSAVEVNHAVGMGAILGAPFMLATLSLGVMAWFAGRKRGWLAAMKPEHTGQQRDIKVFLIGFGLAVIAALLPAGWHTLQLVIAFLLGATYFLYLLYTIRASKALASGGHATEADQELYLSRWVKASFASASVQLFAGLTMLVWGARLFVDGASSLSSAFGVSAFLISLLIIPVATELPEKVNSVIWIRKGKDTLAFGNITGAMVFQGTVIPAMGIMIMPWHFDVASHASYSVILAITGVAWLWWLQYSKRLNAANLMFNVALYAVFIAIAMTGF